MLTKTKNIRKKSKKKIFSKLKKVSEHMAQGKPQLKFESNPCIKYRDRSDTDALTTDDGRQTDDGQKPHTMTSADRVEQS